MSNCSQHKRDVAGMSSMTTLAEKIGDLHYETLSDLLHFLSLKLLDDANKDRQKGKIKLSYKLLQAAEYIQKAQIEITSAWQISKPFMNRENLMQE